MLIIGYKHRARKQLKTLRDKTRAAILIQHCVRGFLVKRWYIRTITEVRAAVKLQALVRYENSGFVMIIISRTSI